MRFFVTPALFKIQVILWALTYKNRGIMDYSQVVNDLFDRRYKQDGFTDLDRFVRRIWLVRHVFILAKEAAHVTLATMARMTYIDEGVFLTNIQSILEIMHGCDHGVSVLEAVMGVNPEEKWRSGSFSFYTSEVEEIDKKAASLQSAIVELKFFYFRTSLAARSIEEYLDIGRSLRNSREMKSLVALIEDIYLKRQHSTVNPEYIGLYKETDQVRPFIFVCCSSFAGKTQIPFSLSGLFPFVYLLDFVGNQSIYEPFKQISERMQDLIKLDIELLRIDPDLTTEFGQVKNSYFSMDNFESLDKKNFKFHSAGFLFKVIKMILGEFRNDPDRAWLNIELFTDFDVLSYERMQLSTCRFELSEMFRLLSPLFPGGTIRDGIAVFIDECDTSHSEFPYVFKRNLVRSMGIVPIIMGTDSKLYNLIDKTKMIGSRGTERAWCFTFSQLPNYPEALLEHKVNELEQKLKDGRSSFGNIDDRIEFLHMLKRAVALDRPAFIQKLLTHLDTRITEVDFDFDVDFHSASSSVFAAFLGNKNIRGSSYTKFLQSQMFYAQDRLAIQAIHEASRPGASMIHCHLGYLCEKRAGQREPFIGITTLVVDEDGKVLYVPATILRGLTDRFTQNQQYYPKAFFGSFKKQPISGLAFASNCLLLPNVENSKALFLGENSRPLSTRSAVKKIESCYDSASVSENTAANGRSLEALCKAGVLHSLSVKGFKGMTAADWIPWFCVELSMSEKSKDPYPVVMSDDLRDRLSKIKLPFVSPTSGVRPDSEFDNSSDWNEHMESFYRQRLEYNIGTMHHTAHKEKIDCKVYSFRDGMVMRFECKNWLHSVTGSDLVPIIVNLWQRSALLNVILVRKFGGMDEIVQYLSGKIPEGGALLSFARLESGETALNLKIGCLKTCSRFILLIDTVFFE